MNNEAHIYLTIDQGGQSTRASLYNRRGDCLAMARCPVATLSGPHGQVEHDAAEIIDSIESVIDDVVRQKPEHTGVIMAAGLATQRSSIACWDKQSTNPLSNIISWQDHRAAQWLTDLHPDPLQVHQITGLKLSPHFGASKLHWCLQHLDAVKQAQVAGNLGFGPMAAYLIHKLLKEHPHLVDAVNASRTQCWDIKQQIWSEPLLQLFDLPPLALPVSVPTEYAFGHLARHPDIPLTTVSGDQSAALYAFGEPEKDNIYINAGTGAFVLQPTGTTCQYHKNLLTSIIRQDKQHAFYALEGTVNGAGAALKWFAEHISTSENELLGQLQGRNENNENIPLFLNSVSGLGSPFWETKLQPHFIGNANTQDKTIAILESIVFLLVCNINILQDINNSRQIIITGGLSRLDLICQGLADLGKLVVVRPEITEATSHGLAYQLANMPTEWPGVLINKQFSPQANRQLEGRFQQWRLALQAALDSLQV